MTTTKPCNGMLASIRRGFSDYVKNVRLFSRNARLYLFGSFLIGVNFQVFQLLLNLYLKELGFLEGDIGRVLSSRAIGMTLIAIPAALILSRIRLKPILLGSCVLFAVFSFFITSYETLILLMGFAMLGGMAVTFYQVAAAPFYMRNSTPPERTHLFSFSFGTMLLAGMIGSVTSGKIVTVLADVTGDMVLGYRYTLYMAIAVGLLALIPFMMIRSSRPSPEEDRISLNMAQLRRRGKFYFKISISNFLVGMGAGLIIPFLNLYFRDRFHLQPDTIGLFYFLVHFSMFSGILSGPILAKKLGLVRTVVITQLASLPFMLILSYTYTLPLAVVAFIVRGGLMNLGQPIVTNFGMEVAEKREQGLVNALLAVAWTSSWMISAAVGGKLIEEYGYTFTMNLTIILYIISTFTFFFFFRKGERKTKSLPRWEIVRENVS
ncbi:MAG: MFS transporter [candidate division Zixibacteria bacterium]|nr:MFS transporter [candidate division Zixibacteria bacterium]